jgi:hypothetical protein
MSWFENNPIGLVLGSVCGLMLMIAVALGWVWSKPADSGASASDQISLVGIDDQQKLFELGPLSQYREFTERPVFDASRRPVVPIEGEELDLENSTGTNIADAPKVKLSGVIITPERSMVTLTPIEGGDSIIAYKGKLLGADYAGWAVVDIDPRQVVLASTDGDELQIDLIVNDQQLEIPPQLETSESVTNNIQENGSGSASSVDNQPLSRAEEIRQRIAERREELRRQAQSETQNEDAGTQKQSEYQNTIRSMIKRRDLEGDEKNDKTDDGSDS